MRLEQDVVIPLSLYEDLLQHLQLTAKDKETPEIIRDEAEKVRNSLLVLAKKEKRPGSETAP